MHFIGGLSISIGMSAQLWEKNLEKEIFRIIVNLPWNPGLHGPDTLWTIITDYIRTLRKDKSNEEHMKVNQKFIYQNYPMNWKTDSNNALVLKNFFRELKGGPWVVMDKKIFLQK